MIWTLIINSHNSWYINYIEKKLIQQIENNNLSNFVEVVVFETKLKINSKYISIIDNIEISDNYIIEIYNIIINSDSDCIGLSGSFFIKNNSYSFTNCNNENLIYIPISQMNPIKLDLIKSKYKNIYSYINCTNISEHINSVEYINKPLVFFEKVIQESYSIIITAYNASKYIEECLDSIENQTYFKDNDNYEILIGVDGCQDTLDTLNSIKNKFRNLKIYMMNSNKGTYITTNTLITLAKYNNIIRFDSDDIMDINLVNTVAHNKKDYDIVVLGYVNFEDDKISNILELGGIVYFKKDIMEIAGGYQPWRCAADTELLIRLSNVVKISYLNKAVFYRRIHKNSLTNNSISGYNSELRNKYSSLIKSSYNNDEIKIERIINSNYFSIENYEIEKSPIIIDEYKKTLNNVGKIQCIISRDIENNPFEPVKKMILSNFLSSKYNNTLVILGYNRMICEISDYRKMYPNKKIVIYQLEQLFDNSSHWYNINSNNEYIRKNTINNKRRLSECDEIWDYDLDNIEFLKKEGFKNIIHKPLEFTNSLIRKNNVITPKYDLLFFGSVNDKRAKILSILSEKYNLCIIAPKHEIDKYNFKNVFNPKYNDELFNYIFDSKIIINLHYYESELQEQVRLFELLINNKFIISEKSKRNYYKDLIYEFNDVDDMINKIDFALKNDIWKNINISEKFKIFNKLKTRILVTTSSFGVPLSSKWVDQIIDDKYEIVFNRVSSDNNFSKKLSMSPRLRAKLDRMLMWETHPGFDYYIWLDSSFSILSQNSIQWIINQCTDVDAVFFKHSKRNSVTEEFNFVFNELNNNNKYLLNRYEDEPLVEELNSYYLDNNFNDKFLIESGIFIYSKNIVQNKEYNIMKEWYYYNCKWSTLDQLSLPYLLQKFKIKFKFFDTNIYNCPYFKFIHWESK